MFVCLFVCLFVCFVCLFVCFSLKADFEEGLKTSVVMQSVVFYATCFCWGKQDRCVQRSMQSLSQFKGTMCVPHPLFVSSQVSQSARACMYVCVCVRVRACVRARACVRGCVRARVFGFCCFVLLFLSRHLKFPEINQPTSPL